jgi:hypothetical protein
MWRHPLRRAQLDRYRPAPRAAVDRGAAEPNQGKSTTSTWAAGAARNASKVVTRMRLPAVSASAERLCKGIRTSPSAEAATSRRTATAPRCHLWWPAVPDGASGSRPDLQSSLGADQDRREMVSAARGRTDGHASRRPPARHLACISPRLCLQGVTGVSAHQDGEEALNHRRESR